MKVRDSALKISILISLVHLILGNLIGSKSGNLFIEVIFLPYSFIGGISNFAGRGLSSIILEVLGLVLMTLIFYPVGLFLKEKNRCKDFRIGESLLEIYK